MLAKRATFPNPQSLTPKPWLISSPRSGFPFKPDLLPGDFCQYEQPVLDTQTFDLAMPQLAAVTNQLSPRRMYRMFPIAAGRHRQRLAQPFTHPPIPSSHIYDARRVERLAPTSVARVRSAVLCGCCPRVPAILAGCDLPCCGGF